MLVVLEKWRTSVVACSTGCFDGTGEGSSSSERLFSRLHSYFAVEYVSYVAVIVFTFS